MLSKLSSVYSSLSLGSTEYVNGGQNQTVANLLANFPPSIAYVGKYARVSDLWGSADEVMRCSYDGSTYFWRPQRTDYAVSATQTSGTMTLTPLITAPVVVLTTTLLGTMNLVPAVTNVWPGCTFTVKTPGIGLNILQFTGLVGGLTKTLLGNSDYSVTYTAAGWRS